MVVPNMCLNQRHLRPLLYQLPPNPLLLQLHQQASFCLKGWTLLTILWTHRNQEKKQYSQLDYRGHLRRWLQLLWWWKHPHPQPITQLRVDRFTPWRMRNSSPRLPTYFFFIGNSIQKTLMIFWIFNFPHFYTCIPFRHLILLLFFFYILYLHFFYLFLILLLSFADSFFLHSYPFI